MIILHKTVVSCKICSEMAKEVFTKRILNKYEVKYYQCPRCAFLFTEDAFWLDEAYTDALSVIDTGIMQRNLDMVLEVNVMIHTIFALKDNNTKNTFFLDYGGGYGIFTRMMRDLGYQWYWSDKYAQNLVARKFEYNGEKPIFLITAFELFEHLPNPIEELKKIFNISKTVIFSTLLYDDEYNYQKKGDWWYYSVDTGQHISFYSKKTLEIIASLFHLHYCKISESLHIITDKKIKKIDLLKYKIFHKYFREIAYRKQCKYSLAFEDMNLIIKESNEDYKKRLTMKSQP